MVVFGINTKWQEKTVPTQNFYNKYLTAVYKDKTQENNKITVPLKSEIELR